MKMGTFLLVFFCCFTVLAGRGYAKEEHSYVVGAGGVPLAVTAAGDKSNPEILFLHGLGHARETFSFQFQSDLAKDYRLVAFDLRGHGQSGKPWTTDGYMEPAVWAQDVLAVMDHTGLKKPVVVGWSYGGLVAADLIRQTGADRLSGVVLVSSLAGMISYTPDFSKGGEQMAQAYRLFAQPSFSNQERAVGIVAPFLVAKTPESPWPDAASKMGLMVPPYVRPLLTKHKTANADLIARIDFPILIMHGEDDAAIPQSAVDEAVKAIPTTQVFRFDDTGHSPFAERPAQFNAELRRFTNTVWKGQP